MQFPESWLRALVNPPLTTDELCHLLTMAGLEVEEVAPVAAAFSNVVVARVLAVDKHPDADKLKLCKVDAGEFGVLQIVCGAPNVAADMVVPCALVGAKLPEIEIKKAKVRGVESFGMLCSARELGLSDDHGGLLSLPAASPLGRNLRDVMQLDDVNITIKLTPNRADCLSLVGIAREVAALTGAPLTLPQVEAVAPAHADQRAIKLDAPAACPRYCGRIVRGVDAKAATPDWMKQRLERCGVRSISALVDVTNYVMLELGQPLHAFDDARLAGDIHVRYPKAGEELLLLNEQTVTPAATTALIADARRALAMAGIMGGHESGIGDSTSDLFLESAFFSPDAIVGKARALGFSSDASYRYERGVDFELQRTAIERATQLIMTICGGSPGPIVEAVSPENLPKRAAVHLRPARVAKVLGIALEPGQIQGLLTGLGLGCSRDDRGGETGFSVVPPSYRFDISREEDLIEELARLHGYDNIPARPPQACLEMLPQTELRRPAGDVRQLLATLGYHEVVNFSFVEAAWEADFCANPSPIVLANPIASQMGTMRSSLIGGLVGNVVGNRSRQWDRVRVFEIGRCFIADGTAAVVPGFRQPLRVAGLCAGTTAPEQWGSSARAVDFFDAKADVEALLAPASLRFEKLVHPALHPGRAARIFLDGSAIGLMGELHPRWVQKYGLGGAPVVFELELDALLSRNLPVGKELSRFPAVTRDIALVVDVAQPAQALLDALLGKVIAIVKRIDLFDVYHGKGLPEGKKSLAFRIVMQDTQRTLSDVEVEAAVVELVELARSGFAAELRN